MIRAYFFKMKNIFFGTGILLIFVLNNMLKSYRIVSLKDLETAFEIRRKVFVDEQKVDAADEYDEFEQSSQHYLAEYDGIKAATARWRKTEKGIKMERFAVLKEFRGKGLGAEILKTALEDAGTSDLVYLHAQTHAQPFYEKYGFEAVGELFYECEIPHYKMVFRVKS